MNEKEKYLNLYRNRQDETSQTDILPGHMGGGYGRICWGENMLETLKGWKVSSLLDVGCGHGNFCDAATLFVQQVYGLDIASVATGNVIDNPEITYLDGEAKALPLPDNAVEWITSFDCLEHCLEHDIDKILKEFNRVARNGFVLSISYEPCEADGMPLHMTVKPEAWWFDKLSRYGQVTKEGNAPITGAPYLICRKPVEKSIICYCAGSIGTRLRTIAWAERLARQTGRRMKLVWLKNDPLCRSGFSSLFTNPIPQISEEEMLALWSCKIYANIKEVADQALISGGKSLRSIVQKWGVSEIDAMAMDDIEDHLIVYAPTSQIGTLADDSDNLLGLLEPTVPVQKRIRELRSHLNINKSVMGVHARGTDFDIPSDVYGRQMHKAISQNANQTFFVCSDDLAYEHALKTKFPDRVIVRSKSAWRQKKDSKQPWVLGNVDTSSVSVEEALVDLYLLAETQFEIYHESSAYAQTGAWLSCRSRAPENVPVQGKSSLVEKSPANNFGQTNQPYSKSGGRQTIYYYCPSGENSSAGIRRLYRHVAILKDAGFSASLLREEQGAHHHDMPNVPVTLLDLVGKDPNAIFVIPEGMPRIMHLLKDHPGRRFVIALSWVYIFSTLPDNVDWRSFNIERVLAVSPTIAETVSWSMGLPVDLLSTSIDHDLYRYDPKIKQMQISYIHRKAEHIKKLQALLASRNKDYLNKFKWVKLDGLSIEAYAEQIRRSMVFLSTSLAEGFPTSCLEAMAAGALVAGYDALGGKGVFTTTGNEQNAMIAPNGDYVSLAYQLAPALDDLLTGRLHCWDSMLQRARQTALQYTIEEEASSVISYWTSVLQTGQNEGPGKGTYPVNIEPYSATPSMSSQTIQTLGI